MSRNITKNEEKKSMLKRIFPPNPNSKINLLILGITSLLGSVTTLSFAIWCTLDTSAQEVLFGPPTIKLVFGPLETFAYFMGIFTGIFSLFTFSKKNPGSAITGIVTMSSLILIFASVGGGIDFSKRVSNLYSDVHIPANALAAHPTKSKVKKAVLGGLGKIVQRGQDVLILSVLDSPYKQIYMCAQYMGFTVFIFVILPLLMYSCLSYGVCTYHSYILSKGSPRGTEYDDFSEEDDFGERNGLMDGQSESEPVSHNELSDESRQVPCDLEKAATRRSFSRQAHRRN